MLNQKAGSLHSPPPEAMRRANHRLPSAIVVVLACTVALAGCGRPPFGTLINSNLDNPGYSNGPLPEGQIPGNPVGDRTSNITQTVRITSGGTALIRGRKLVINGGSVDYNPHLEVLTTPKRYVVSLKGVRESASDLPTRITVLDHLFRAVVVEFQGDHIIVRSGGAGPTSVLTSTESPPISTQDVHTIGIGIVEADATVTVEVHEKNSGELFRTPALHFLDSGFQFISAIRIESSPNVEYFVQQLFVIFD